MPGQLPTHRLCLLSIASARDATPSEPFQPYFLSSLSLFCAHFHGQSAIEFAWLHMSCAQWFVYRLVAGRMQGCCQGSLGAAWEVQPWCCPVGLQGPLVACPYGSCRLLLLLAAALPSSMTPDPSETTVCSWQALSLPLCGSCTTTTGS